MQATGKDRRDPDLIFAPLKDPVRTFQAMCDGPGAAFEAGGQIRLPALAEILRCVVLTDVPGIVSAFRRLQNGTTVTLNGP